MTPDAPMIALPFGIAALAVLGIAVVAVFRSRKQATSAPELRHVLPVGAGCVSAFAGFVLCAVGNLVVGSWLVAAGLLVCAAMIAWNADKMAAQPTSTDVQRLRGEMAVLDGRVSAIARAVAREMLETEARPD